MSRYLLVGVSGQPGLKLVDLESGSVEAVAPDQVDATVAKVREYGGTIFRGIDVAIAVEDRQDAVGRFFFQAGSAR